MIAGIVLAAGRSRRMGEPKAFLRLGGRSFLERAVTALRDGGCEQLVVVAGAPEDDVAERVADLAEAMGAYVVRNPDAASEQADSLRIGLQALSDEVEAALAAPVDIPGMDTATVREVIAAFRRTGAPVVLPGDGERRGHPVLFARRVWPEFDGDLPEGARTVIHAHAAYVVEVRVPRLPPDVDTPEDYRRLGGRAR